ncbi:YaeQ family protein [Lysobacter sp. 22409]|uniref:YaeQ family protein n=1 Tax=Lysobacter sp. 22409 TaxID=3453917 RepID=UPI003F82DE0D
MAPNATIVKIELQISDMDRHYYAAHALTLAQHPSETQQRLMVRMLAFALNAQERLEFGPGLSSEDEPDVVLRDYTGDIDLWIDVGQPDESRIRKACGRARQVVVVNYGGRAADIWWEKNVAILRRLKNLTVLDLDPAAVEAMAGLVERSFRLDCQIQDGEVSLSTDKGALVLTPGLRQSADARAA